MGDVEKELTRFRRRRSTGSTTPTVIDPEKPSWVAHMFDLLFFRALSVGLLWVNRDEISFEQAGLVLCLFFMPDWLRGSNGAVPRLLLRLFDRGRG